MLYIPTREKRKIKEAFQVVDQSYPLTREKKLSKAMFEADTVVDMKSSTLSVVSRRTCQVLISPGCLGAPMSRH